MNIILTEVASAPPTRSPQALLATRLGRELRRIRKHHRLPQHGVAAKAGIDLDTVGALESGRGTVKPLIAIMRVLECHFVESRAHLELGRWLAAQRKAAGLSQEGLAARIGCSKRTIIKLERGRGHTSSLVAVMSAMKLDVGLDLDEQVVSTVIPRRGAQTPLRYPGGKSRAVWTLSARLPRVIDEYREPFLGGGSVALHVTARFPGASIWVNDAYKPLISFWSMLQNPEQARRLVERLRHLRSEHPDVESARELFVRCCRELDNPDADDFTVATSFYVVNRCSFSGPTQSGSFSPEASRTRWTMSLIEKLIEITPIIREWRITNFDYRDVLREPWSGSSPLAFLDPPYDILSDRLYGRRGDEHRFFDHGRFRRVVRNTPAPILMTYSSSVAIRRMYRGWQQEPLDLSYSINSKARYRRIQKFRRELLLRNYHLITGERLVHRPAPSDA